MVRLRYATFVKRLVLIFLAFTALQLLTKFFLTPSSFNDNLHEHHKHEINEDITKTKVKRKLNFKTPALEAVFNKHKLGNYEPVNLKLRSGPGEGGVPVHLDESKADEADKTVREFGFNMVVSDMISLDRRIKDTRPAECKNWHYPELAKLPNASVVIVFNDEGWSTLIRTVHSVFNTSPPELIAEVVMVDDFSTKAFLKSKLDNYVKRFNGKVKLIHTKKREGLIRARVIGAEHATGEVIVVLDAHCECVVNWLPPLLTRVAFNRKTLAVPIVDSIDWNTLEHTDTYEGVLNRGIFEWGFLYKEVKIPQRERMKHKYLTEPYWSPTHAGGLLAIDKKWFFELGGYDPGIKIWGAEQYELSFKVWQCGGVIEWVPCSHVAHIYRGPRVASSDPPEVNVNQNWINHMRMAEVWMDEYKEYYYIREPQIRKIDFGDISAQVAIREKLQCKSFKWFIENIAYELLAKFPLPPKNVVWGKCQNKHHNVCMNSPNGEYGDALTVENCKNTGYLLRLNEKGELSSGEHCFQSKQNKVVEKFCIDGNGVWNPVGEWRYDNKSKIIRSTKTNKCVSTDGSNLKLKICNVFDMSQKWEWKEIYYK